MKANINFFREIGGVGKMKDNALFYKRTENNDEEHFIEIIENVEEIENEQ